MTPEQFLRRVKEEAERATPRPWTHCVMANVETPEKLLAYLKTCIENGKGEFYFVSATKADGDADVCHSGNGPTSKENNAFIASARTNVPRLVRWVELQRDERQSYSHYRDAEVSAAAGPMNSERIYNKLRSAADAWDTDREALAAFEKEMEDWV